jgi:hypothetical protein
MYTRYKIQLQEVRFLNNVAEYGPNFASYPVKIGLEESQNKEILIQNVPSGQIFPNTLNLVLYDSDDQVTNLKNYSQIKIKEVLTGSSVLGQNIAIVKQGKAEFNQTIFTYMPGTVSIPFKLQSNAFDLPKLKEVFGEDYEIPLMHANFRW